MSRFSVDAVFKAIDQFSGPVDKMDRSMRRFQKSLTVTQSLSKGLKSFTGGIESGMRSLTYGTVAAYGMSRGIGSIVGAYARVQEAQIDFTTMFKGNSDLAKKTVKDLRDLAAETSFGFNDLAGASTRLLMSGAATSNNLLETLRQLGDLTKGSPEKLERVSLVYSQVMAKMRMDTRDVWQFTDAGIPIMEELQNVTGKTGEEFKTALEQGQISSDVLKRALDNLTKSGGRLHNAMANRFKSIFGQWDAFKEKINILFSDIGEAAEPAIMDFLKFAIGKINEMIAWVAKPENKKKILEFAQAFVDGIKKIVTFLENHGEAIATTLKWLAYFYIGSKVELFLSNFADNLVKVVRGIGWLIGFNGPGLVKWMKVATAAAFTLDLAMVPLTATIAAVAAAAVIGYGVGTFLYNWIGDAEWFISLMETIFVKLEKLKTLVTGGAITPRASDLMVTGGGMGLPNDTGPVDSWWNRPLWGGEVISPQERLATSVSESINTSKTELLIKDQSGSAELKEPKKAASLGVRLTPAGAF